mmetsp:Transcript_70855/g.125132  ORF Transcript_70855/g.125132 Transcript_70855/m.125132 type:complete len:1335 (+) Transcript_70855:87-4091(+)
MAKDARKNLSEPITKRGATSLRRIPFLQDCKDTILHTLVQRLATRFDAPGEILARQGEECDKILLLGKGDIEVLTDGEKVAELGDGQVVGDPKALLGVASCRYWKHTVATTSFCDFMVLSQRDFLEVMSMHKPEAIRIAKLIPPERDPSVQKDSGAGGGSVAINSKDKEGEEKAEAKKKKRNFLSQTGTVYFDNEKAVQKAGEKWMQRSATKKEERLQRANSKPVAERSSSPAEVRAPEKPPTEGLNANKGKLKSTVSRMGTMSLAWRQDEGDAEASKGPDEEVQPVDMHDLQKEARRRESAATLDGIDFFAFLDTFSFEKLIDIFEKKLWRKGDDLLIEGKPASAMHVVHTGYIAVTIAGKQQAKLGPKSIVGERSVLNTTADEFAPCGATVTAVSSIVMTMSAARYRLFDLFKKDPALLEHFEQRFEVERTRRGVSSFKNIKLFENADPMFAQALELHSQERTLDIGELLLRQDEPCNEAVLLHQGSVDILKDSEVVVSMTVSTIKDAVIFGEFTVLGLWNAPKASIMAKTRCKVQIITADVLRRCLDLFPDESIIFRRLVEARMEGIATQEAKFRPVTPSSSEESFSSEEESDDEMWEGDLDSPLKRTRRGTGGQLPKKKGAGAARKCSVQHHRAKKSDQADEEDSDEDEEYADVEHISDEDDDDDDDDDFHHPGAWGQESSSEEEATPARKKSVMRQGTSEQEKMVLPAGLQEVPEFKELPPEIVHHMESHMHARLFMPGQVVLRQGMDMADVYILQRGKCTVEIFGADLEPMQGPSVIGGMPSVLAKKVFTTVIAQDTCFVGKVSKRHFAAIFDKHHHHRKLLLAAANREFTKLCDTFHDTMLVKKGLHRQLANMPFLAGASEAFILALADHVDPRLLLPGQDVVANPKAEDDDPHTKGHHHHHHHGHRGSHDFKSGTAPKEQKHRHARHKPEMWFIFEGHLHYLQNGAVVGTISPKTVFGVLEVFGIMDVGKNVRIKCDEVCKVGSISQKHLYQVLARFPEERAKFERLVHNIMEDSVHERIVKNPYFASMPVNLLSKVSFLLDRRFLMADVTVTRAGDTGDFMVLVNSGKAELVYQGLQVSMLWPGKVFGASQMLGLHREYHATMRTLSTCHLLLMFWKNFSTLVGTAADRTWLEALKQRAEAVHEMETKGFVRKIREQKLMHKMGMPSASKSALGGESTNLVDFLQAWRAIVQDHGKTAHEPKLPEKEKEKPDSSSKVMAQHSLGNQQSTKTDEFSIFMPAPPSQKAPRRLEFSRRLQRRELILKDETRASLSKWKVEARSGRRDAWTGIMAPAWLRAVREEIPKQYMELKAQAKGGEMEHLPSLR